MAPIPPSFVALPPIPMYMFTAPFFSASAINCPVPFDVVFKGFLSFDGTKVRPEASAISITATSFFIIYDAVITLPKGSETLTSTFR